MMSPIFRVDRTLGIYSPTGVHASLLFTLMSLISGKQGKIDSPALLSYCCLQTPYKAHAMH